MRIISGSKRGMRLLSPKGDNTRPTTDRIKETLFNMISADVPGSRVLDVFAGSGQLGLEAMSRGAESAMFIERDRAASDIILTNIKKTGFTDDCHLIGRDIRSAIPESAEYGPFDLIFMDPPYKSGLEKKALSLMLSVDGMLAEASLIILESSIDSTPEMPPGLKIRSEKLYKTNKHIFIERDL